jgi:hypothetical protein
MDESRSRDLAARDAIVAEHGQLDDLLQQLEHRAASHRLPLLLEGLGDLLRRHFAREEAPDGLYEALRSKAKADFDRVRALLGEHTALLAAVDSLGRQSRGQPGSPELPRGIERLCWQMRAHEHEESRLLIDSLSRGQ